MLGIGLSANFFCMETQKNPKKNIVSAEIQHIKYARGNKASENLKIRRQ